MNRFLVRRKQPRRYRLIQWFIVFILFYFFIIWLKTVKSVVSPNSSSSNVIPLITPPVTTSYTNKIVLEYFSSRNCSKLVWKFEYTSQIQEEKFYQDAGSMKVSSGGLVDFYNDNHYVASLFPLDGCVQVFHYPAINKVKLFSSDPNPKQQISQESLNIQRLALNPEVNLQVSAKYRVIFSCESSEYFGYQVWANKLAFLQSQKGQDATWTRLLTCQTPDDIAQDIRFPTFSAPAHIYSKRYSPLNKPDIIEKWYASSLDSPKEDVIVVIDPDSFLLLPLYETYIKRISPGNAIGQAAYYYGSSLAQMLWKELCEANCDVEMDLVGVPYILHREDLRKIAPLWKMYVLKIKYHLEQVDPNHKEFANKYGGLDVNWASEMYGYNMASAHLRIKHQVVFDLQVRDVEGPRDFEGNKNKYSIHMGRAWFPKGHPDAKKWLHTEGKGFSYYGDQVWCKCNYTASTIKPWPLPDGLDFQSYHTLRLLHDSEEQFGPVPENSEWRRKDLKNLKETYKWTHN